MTNYKTTLDEMLERLYRIAADTELAADRFDPYAFNGVSDAKQAILRWVADEVIGEDEAAAEYSYLQPTLDEMTKSAHEKAVRNQLRAEQRARIIQ